MSQFEHPSRRSNFDVPPMHMHIRVRGYSGANFRTSDEFLHSLLSAQNTGNLEIKCMEDGIALLERYGSGKLVADLDRSWHFDFATYLPNVKKLTLCVENLERVAPTLPTSLESLELICGSRLLLWTCSALRNIQSHVGPAFKTLIINSSPMYVEWYEKISLCSIIMLAAECIAAGINLKIKAGEKLLFENGRLHPGIVEACASCKHVRPE